MAKRLWLGNTIKYDGPRAFSPAEVALSHDLFADRHALFYTPTTSIPDDWIGSGDLDVILPIAPPSYFEFIECRLYQSPRLWVDLLQRATHKIRWQPMHPARVVITRYDYEDSWGPVVAGAKALIDALKVAT